MVEVVLLREWTSTWQLGKELQGRMVLPNVQYGMLELRIKIEIDLEIAELNVLGWKEDMTDFDADIDDPSMGHGENWVAWCTRAAVHTRNWRCPARSRRQR